MSLRCVVFDFDGTVADTFATTISIVNQLAPEFGFRAAADDELDVLRDSSYKELAERLGVKMRWVPFIATRVRKEMAGSIQRIKPIAGLPEVLGQLRGAGLELGLFTSNSRSNVEKFLRANALEDFSFISSASNLWGKERHLRSLLKRRGLTTAQAIYVGDEPRDVDACHGLSLPVVAVTWGFTSKRRLLTHQPTHVVDTPSELLHLLTQGSS